MSDFPTIKTSFEKRLEHQLGTDGSRFINKNILSIFAACDFDVNDTELSMSLSDLLEYEIKDGKFVLPENADSDADTQIAAELEASAEPLAAELGAEGEIVSENIDVPQGDIVEEVIKENETDKEKLEANEEEETDPNNKFVNLLNSLLEDPTVKAAVDTDNSGDLSEEEINVFFTKISSADGNTDNLSIEDLLKAVEGTEETGTESGTSTETTGTTETTTPANQTTTQRTNNNNNVQNAKAPSRANSNSGSSGGVSGGSSSRGYGGGTSKKTLATMSESDLMAELDTATGDATDKQNAYNDALDASQVESSAEKSAYQAYHDKLAEVDGPMAKQLDDLKTAIGKQQGLINEQEKQISAQEGTVKSAEADYNNAKTIRTNLESSKSELESSLNDSSLTSSQRESIQKKLDEIETEISNAQKAEDQAQKDLEAAQKTLDDYNAAKDKLATGEGGLDSLNSQMSTLQSEIATKHSDVADLQTKYNEAKATADKSKQAAVTKAKSNLTSSQDYVVQVKNALSSLKDKKNSLHYAANPYDDEAGARIAQQAQYVPGTYGMCLKGVSDTLSRVYGTGLGGMRSAYMATEALRGNVAGYEEIASHFQEVEVDRADLANLPAGAIVVWDRNYDDQGNLHGGSGLSDVSRTHGHISISLGDGRESSDHIQEQQVDRDAEYYVFFPIS